MDSSGRDNSKRSRPPKSSSKKSGSSKAGAASSGAEAQETARFHCNYCSRDISYTVRARCGECADFDLCLDCFSVGAALDQHSPTHAYRLVEVVTKPVFQEGWGADHEERLIEGLELYGVGNWEDIAKLIGDRSATETEAHFMQAYLSSSTAPVPNMSKVIGPDKDAPYDPNPDANIPDPKSLRVMHLYQNEEIACWMPKRGDFVYEYDNDAEEILADMEMSEEDSKQDTELKLRVLEIYNAKLDEREARKQCVLERGLLEFKSKQAIDKKRSKDEREIREHLRVFARFHPDHADHVSYLNSLAEERALRLKLDGLREARAWGASTVTDANKYSASKARRGDGASNDTLLVTQATTGRRTKAKLNNNNSGGGSGGHGSGSRTAGDGGGSSSERDGDGDGDRNRERDGDRERDGERDGDRDRGRDRDRGADDGGGVSLTAAGGSMSKAEREDVSELMTHSGAELLSIKELLLCRAIKLYPHQYMVVKETLIREGTRVGGLKKKDVKMIKLDHTKALKIYEYLTACGWLGGSTSSAATATANGSSNNPILSNPAGTGST